jgi:hypothetical protein
VNKKNVSKQKLNLDRRTVARLSTPQLGEVAGAGRPISIWCSPLCIPTEGCPTTSIVGY